MKETQQPAAMMETRKKTDQLRHDFEKQWRRTKAEREGRVSEGRRGKKPSATESLKKKSFHKN